MKKLRFWLSDFPPPLPKKGKGMDMTLPITRKEFFKEGARLRDEIARVENDLTGFGNRLYEVEKKTDKWQRPKD